MSQLDHVELLSVRLNFIPLFTGFQSFGNGTTLQVDPGANVLPVAVTGGGGSNPVAVWKNTTRITTIVLVVAGTAASGKTIAFDVRGFSQVVPNSGTYIGTKFFAGEAQTSAYSASGFTATGQFCDQFDLKSFAGFNVNYIEPADGSSAAMLIMDIRGSDFVVVRLAQGASGPATTAQVWLGCN